MTRGLIHPMIHRGEGMGVRIGAPCHEPSFLKGQCLCSLRIATVLVGQGRCRLPHEGCSCERIQKDTQSQPECSKNCYDGWNWLCVLPSMGEITWSIV